MAAPKYSRYYTYIKPIAENKMVKSTAPYIFSILAIIIFIVFAIRPTIETISNLQKNITNNKITLEALQTKVSNLEQAKINLNNMSDQDRIKIETALPSQTNVTTLIKSLQDSSPAEASISALQIQPVTLLDTSYISSNPLTFDVVTFNYDIQGSFTQILAVLTNLSKSSRLTSFDNVLITKSSDNPAVLSITGRAYYLK